MTGSRERPYLGAGDENLRRGRAAPRLSKSGLRRRHPAQSRRRCVPWRAAPPGGRPRQRRAFSRPLAAAPLLPACQPSQTRGPAVPPGEGGGGRTQPKIPALQTSSTSSGPQDDLGTPEITLNGVGGGGGGLGRKSSESPPVLEQVRTP